MLDPCKPCIWPGYCEQCIFGYRPAIENHERMKSIIEEVEKGNKPLGYSLVEKYKTYHPNWINEMNY